MASEAPTVFVRKASGLVREIGVIDTLFYNIGITNFGIGVSTLVAWAYFVAPGSSVPGVVIISLLIASIPGALLWSAYSAMMPRTGGDYVVTSRVAHPLLGFWSSWGESIPNAIWAGASAAFLPAFTMYGSFTIMGSLTKNDALVTFGNQMATPTYSIIVGTIALALTFILMNISVRAIFRVQNVILPIALLGAVVSIGLLAVSTNADFIARFNAYAQPFTGSSDYYHEIINMSKGAGYNVAPPVSLLATLIAFPIGSFNLGDVMWSSYQSGETKNVARTQAIGMIGAAIVTTTLYLLATTLLTNVAGYEFLNALSFQMYSGQGTLKIPVYPYFNFLVSLLSDNIIVVGIIAVSFICWGWLYIYPVVFMPVRSFFAWSFDRSFPAAIAHVSRRNSPIVASAVAIAIAEVMLIVYSFGSGLYLTMGIALLLLPGFTVPGLVGIYVPFSKYRELYKSCWLSKLDIGPIPAMTICGILNAATNIIGFFAVLLNPLYGANTPLSMIAWFILGVPIPIIIYLATRSYYRRKGIDVDLAFAELPPA